MTEATSTSAFTELGTLADRLGAQANDPKASDADRKSSAGARSAVLGALGALVNGEVNRPPTATAEELENMRPRDAAKFFSKGGVIRG